MSFRHKTGTFAVALALALSAGAANAETSDPQAINAARELMALTIGDELQRQMNEQAWPTTEAMVRASAPQLTPEQMSRLKSEFLAISNEAMSKMMSEVPNVYAKYFSAQELQDILAFYKTSTGKKTIELMPALMGEFTRIIAPQAPAMMIRIRDAFAVVLRENGVTLPTPPK